MTLGPPLFSARFKRGDKIAGRYRVLGVLAAGGQGECYEVVHEFTDQVLVLKVLHTDLLENAELAARVHQEAKRLGKLNHPNIVSVRDGGLTDGADGLPFFVMEKLNGCTLQDILAGFGPMDPYSACSFGADISYALWAIHQHGLIHGDVKPDNLFAHFENDSVRAVVLDLGITVQSTAPDAPAAIVALTPPYSSPEHFEGFVTPRSDLYCLGVVLYTGLTGRHPFSDDTTDEYYRAAHTALDLRPRSLLDANPTLDTPPELNALVMQLLEKDPAKRQRDAHVVNLEFKALIKNLSTKTRTAPALPGPLLSYITARRHATNIPSGPRSISLRKSVQFVPFGPPTPGELGANARIGRTTIDVALPARATRPAEIRVGGGRDAGAALTALAPALVPEAATPSPRPVVLSLVRTQPFTPGPRVAGESTTNDTEPGGALPFPELSGVTSSNLAETALGPDVPSAVGSAPRFADTDPGDTPFFDDDARAERVPASHPDDASASPPRATPPIEHAASPAWLAFVFPPTSPLHAAPPDAPKAAMQKTVSLQAASPARERAPLDDEGPPAMITPVAVEHSSRVRRTRATAVALLVLAIAGAWCAFLYREVKQRTASPSSLSTIQGAAR